MKNEETLLQPGRKTTSRTFPCRTNVFSSCIGIGFKFGAKSPQNDHTSRTEVLPESYGLGVLSCKGFNLKISTERSINSRINGNIMMNFIHNANNFFLSGRILEQDGATPKSQKTPRHFGRKSDVASSVASQLPRNYS